MHATSDRLGWLRASVALLFALGMGLCFLRQRSGSLTVPVMAHFAVAMFTELGTSLV